MGSPFPGPTPPYNNPPIEPQYFQPSRFVISNVTLGLTTTVTTTLNMNYVIGQQVRLLIPEAYGCYQLNDLLGYVISLPETNEVQLTIDSSINVGAYIAASTTNPPQIVAAGDINNGIISTNGRSLPTTTIPGSIINISPY